MTALLSPTRRKFAQLTRRFSTTDEPIRMNFELYENKPDKSNLPLIVMHGLFGSNQNWRSVCRALASKLQNRVYAVDARNHGESPHTSAHGSENMANDVEKFLRDQQLSKTTVMGHSMGGRAMMFFALKYPQLLDRGIIVDISPISIPRSFFEMDAIFSAMKSIKPPASLSLADGRKMARTQLESAIGGPGTAEYILMNLKKDSKGEFYWTLNLDTLHRNLRGFSKFMEYALHLPPFKGPMMFICGKESTYVDPDSFPDIQKIFPNSELQWLEAGHLVHFDQPAQFIELVYNFLKRK